MSARRAFFKYEGLGNDFVVIDAARPDDLPEAEAVRLCDRRRGIGADGVLLVLPATSPGARARMRVVNADGSVPEMCGNGLRCVALHLARTDGLAVGDTAEMIVETDAGPKPCRVTRTAEGAGEIAIDMGIVEVLGGRELTVDGRTFALTTADAGNPHAITLEPFERADVDRYGHALATHPTFPRGTNVEFVRRVSPTRAEVVVWERGVGVTLACGTGACATAAVLASAGLAPYDDELTIELLGGPLAIRVARDGRVHMRGPATLTFAGHVG